MTLDERGHVQADGRRVDDGPVAGDDPGGLELAHPLVHCRGREARPGGRARRSWPARWRAAGRSAAGPRRRWRGLRPSRRCPLLDPAPSIAGRTYAGCRRGGGAVPFLVVLVIAVVVVVLVMRAAAANGRPGGGVRGPRPSRAPAAASVPAARPGRRPGVPARAGAPGQAGRRFARLSSGCRVRAEEPAPAPPRGCRLLVGRVVQLRGVLHRPADPAARPAADPASPARPHAPGTPRAEARRVRGGPARRRPAGARGIRQAQRAYPR